MLNKKNIITAAALALFFTGCSVAVAQNANSLLQMDVKRSSVADTVDVTFFTTGDMSNSVVTRKANNRYVVLLPNVSSSSSVAPGFGAVKDLITDINVKHVDDGIGGYTKVTFGTTKPINIKTHMKKTQPLTQAQKDYKAILAQNNTTTTKQPAASKPVSNTVKQANNPAPAVQKTPAASKPSKTPAKQITQNKNTAAPKLALVDIPKNTVKNIIKPQKKTEVKPVQAQTVSPQPKTQTQPQPKVQNQPKVQQQPAVSASDGYVPKMKFDQNGKRILDLEPRVSHKIVPETPSENVVDAAPTVSQENNNVQSQPATDKTAVDTPKSDNSKKGGFPYWILAAGGSVAVLGILYLVFDAIKHSSDKDKSRLQSFFKISSQNMAKRRKKEYSDIVNNDELSWQEKYKLYTEKESQKVKNETDDMSYVTDLSGVKNVLVEPNKSESKTLKNRDGMMNEEFKKKFSENMQAKISQMEHSLAQTPSVNVPEIASNGVKAEDIMIMNKISDVKLKSFSKPITLKETHRSLAEINRNQPKHIKSIKEGRFVKLKNSPLSVSRRESLSKEIEAANSVTANKILTNNGETEMNNQKENYLLSSLDEYLSILDNETEKKATPAGSLAQLKPLSAPGLNQSNVTNPISHSSRIQPGKPIPYMNGLIVKSGYNIDSEKGFYLVNIDGVSALVGRIKDNVFILKRFDRVIDKPIQVRQDDGNVYIVRVGKYKCLVDVTKDKMGTLIEI